MRTTSLWRPLTLLFLLAVLIPGANGQTLPTAESKAAPANSGSAAAADYEYVGDIPDDPPELPASGSTRASASPSVPGPATRQSFKRVHYRVVGPGTQDRKGQFAGMSAAPRKNVGELPKAAEETIDKPIARVTTNIAPPGRQDDKLPLLVPAALPGQMPLGMDEIEQRPWQPLVYYWQAPSTSHRPLYFEEVNAERHGYVLKRTEWLHPLVSGAKFYATLPALPYLASLDSPWQSEYTLGEYRPGSCVPYRFERIPVRPIPATVEGAAVMGAVILIP